MPLDLRRSGISGFLPITKRFVLICMSFPFSCYQYFEVISKRGKCPLCMIQGVISLRFILPLKAKKVSSLEIIFNSIGSKHQHCNATCLFFSVSPILSLCWLWLPDSAIEIRGAFVEKF